MYFFRDFDTPLWHVFSGNLLMVITIGFYITWWSVSFRPGGSGEKSGPAMGLLSITFLAGLAAVGLLSFTVLSLSGVGRGFPMLWVITGTVVFYVVLLLITKYGFQREVTAELPLIVFWTALEGSVIAVLTTSGRFNTPLTLTSAILLGLALAVGLVCYVLHYRLEEPARFWNGLIPLIADGGVAAALSLMLVIS